MENIKEMTNAEVISKRNDLVKGYDDIKQKLYELKGQNRENFSKTDYDILDLLNKAMNESIAEFELEMFERGMMR